jgi:hypothetical protein
MLLLVSKLKKISKPTLFHSETITNVAVFNLLGQQVKMQSVNATSRKNYSSF